MSEPTIGLLVGMEWSFPPAFLDDVARRGAGVRAEYVRLDVTRMAAPVPYAVVVDRISHEVGFYRAWMKHAALQGVHVVNDPFRWSADDKFFDASLAVRAGVAHPRTVLLPNKEYIPGIDKQKSLRNLAYPFDWDAAVAYVGLPCILKDAHGGGWRGVWKCDTREELAAAYDQTGTMTMVLQEFIAWEHYVRCMVIGREHVLPMPYDPRQRRYLSDPVDRLPGALEARVTADALTLCRGLGYDMNTVEFAVKDGVPYAIDFMNPAPDMDVNSLTRPYFDWVVRTMADFTIALAQRPPREHPAPASAGG